MGAGPMGAGHMPAGPMTAVPLQVAPMPAFPPSPGMPAAPPLPAPTPALVAAMVGPVAAAMPALLAAIPEAPAAELGRIGAPPAPQPGRVPAPPGHPNGIAEPLAERLLGALEIVLGAAAASAVPDELVAIAHTERPSGAVAVAAFVGAGAVRTALQSFDRFGPGRRELAAQLVEILADHPAVVELLEVPAGTEAAMLTGRGRGFLALAVAVADLVVRATAAPIVGTAPDVVVAVAVDVVARLLPGRPMPPGYAAARRATARATYALPRRTHGTVTVSGHRITLGEVSAGELHRDSGVDPAEPANGLVTAVPGGLVIRTGRPDGPVSVDVAVGVEPPDADDLPRYEDVVEISYDAIEGAASILGADVRLQEVTPPWPGSIRARVGVRGRDEHADGTGGDERVSIALWAAPVEPERVLKATDRLGHRLRGEPEPPRRHRPELAYRWIAHSVLSEAFTVTAVTGSSADDVVRAFGADPRAPNLSRTCGSTRPRSPYSPSTASCWPSRTTAGTVAALTCSRSRRAVGARRACTATSTPSPGCRSPAPASSSMPGSRCSPTSPPTPTSSRRSLVSISPTTPTSARRGLRPWPATAAAGSRRPIWPGSRRWVSPT